MTIKNPLHKTLNESTNRRTKIEVFGMGYIGLPLAIRLASQKWSVVGIDIDQEKIARLEQNDLYESETSLNIEFFRVRNQNFLSFSTKPKSYNRSKIGILCVPTPISSNSIKSDKYVTNAVRKFLETAKDGDVIIIESSIQIGTTENIRNIIDSWGRFVVGKNFGLVFCPERIDPLNKKWHLANIPRIIFASDNTTFNIAQTLYRFVNNANMVRVSVPKVAEVIKSFENAFRLVNISLVNELAILCEILKIDVSEVIAGAATKPFGFMPFHPSAGAGGHCIPKDPTFLLQSSKAFGLDFKTISQAIKLNSHIVMHISHYINSIFEKNKLKKSILICGMAYKANMEDMRDSPGFKILVELTRLGFKCSSYDPFFKKHLTKKYLIENNIEGFEFVQEDSLEDDIIVNFQGICVVQHHSLTQNRLKDIYQRSLVPVIYDCQNRIKFNSNSKTILRSLGNGTIG